MMRVGRSTVFASIFALAIAPAIVRADDDKPVTLASPAKAGDSVRYRSTIDVDLNGNEIKVIQNRKHTVKEVKDSGEITLIVAEEGGKLSLGGNEQEIPGGEPTTVTLTKTRKILTHKPDGENPYLSASTRHLLAIVDTPILPDKAVKPGDSWTTELDNPAVKGKKVTVKTTYVGNDKVDGTAVWKIKQTVEADTEAGKMSTETTSLLDASNGQLISAEQTMKGVPGTMGPMDWKGKIVRLKKDEK